MVISIIIRTFNEERYLGELIKAINKQIVNDFSIEIVIVDSGSTDNTLKICESFNCKIAKIDKSDFSFGKSLNLGCLASSGDVFVFVSGHCIPSNEFWLLNLINPIIEKKAVFTYGRQIGNEHSMFSEKQIFKKYFPLKSSIPQNGFFCNNANSAILKEEWERFRFDEILTGLEDLHLAKKIVESGKFLGYVSTAVVYQLHHENWHKIKNRFEREAIALRSILPEVHISFFDFLRYVFSSIFLDIKVSIKEKVYLKRIPQIVYYRTAQYWGSYKGNHLNRLISKKIKDQYFYPKS
jgi:glycosyltransferase involved in cell wall biosynthesis